MEPNKTRTPRTSRAGRLSAEPRTVTAPFDLAECLDTDEDMTALLEAALEDGHPQVIAACLGAIARAKGMAQIAKATGLNREGLYKTLSGEGNPELGTFMKVIKALGFHLEVKTPPD